MELSTVDLVDKTRSAPNSDDLMWPAIEALRSLGGSARIDELFEEVVRIKDFPDELVALRRKDDDPMGLLEYRLAWARTNLKHAGAIESSSHGVWALTEFGFRCTALEMREAYELWKKNYRKKYRAQKSLEISVSAEDEEVPDENETRFRSWKRELLELLWEMPPAAFERLAQRLLREANFQNVQVLGRSGDGGLDGVGDYKLSLVSFPVYFQCKRYRGTVGPSAVRDFRGAMSGRGEKGLLITTGAFTRDAREEASRDGAPPVQLINGDELCDLLKEYRLGLDCKIVEAITVNHEFFDQFD